MKTADAISEILKREGVEWVIGYPVNHILERAAAADIRPIIVRQERTGLHMAEAISRVTSGEKLGVFAMQHGPGTENAYRRRGAGLQQIRADPGHADGLSAPLGLGGAQLQCQRQHGERDQVGRADNVGQGDPCDFPPRFHAAAVGPRRAGAGGDPCRRAGTRRSTRSTMRPPEPCAGGPTPKPCARPPPCC